MVNSWFSLGLGVGIVILVFLVLSAWLRHLPSLKSRRHPSPVRLDSDGRPLVRLDQLPEHWSRLPFLRLDRILINGGRRRRKPRSVQRLVLGYDSTRQNAKSYFFRGLLQSDQVPSGILLDACPHLPSMPTDNTPPSPRCLSELVALGRALAAGADPLRNPLIGLDLVTERARTHYFQYGVLPIIVLDLNAERLKPNTLGSLVLGHQGVLENTAGAEIFETTHLLVAAPVDSEIRHNRVKLVIDGQYVISNRGQPAAYAVKVDGQLSAKLRVGIPFVFEFDPKQETLQLSIVLYDAGDGQSHELPLRLETTPVPAYDLTWIPSYHPVTPEGDDVWIRPYVFFGANHDSTPGAPEIQHPFVILGGYDQNLFGNYSRMYAALSNFGGIDLVRQLRSSFDVILLEYSHVGQSLEINAEALAYVLSDIRTRTRSRNETVLAAISMGGLVSRMALTGLESGVFPAIERQHGVRVWITIDAPHQGAHIPPGLQLLAHEFRWIPGQGMERVNQLLNSVAAKEMLIEHHESLDATSPERARYLATLESWGGFPRNVGTSIAMASGSLAYAMDRRRYQNQHHIPGDCPDPGFLGFGPGCVTLPEQWISIPPNIRFVRQSTKTSYWEQDNRSGLGGLTIMAYYMTLRPLGLHISIGIGVSDRAVQDRRPVFFHAGTGDESTTAVFSSHWTLHILPGWVLSFVDNPHGSSSRTLGYGPPYSLMAGGWLDIPEEIYSALSSIEFASVESLINDVEGPPMPRPTFVPVWSALDISPEFLQVVYDWRTRWDGNTWETWYGTSAFGGAALGRGEFSYEDFVNFDTILFDLADPKFDGRVQPHTLRTGPITEDPVTGEVRVPQTTVRSTKFDWVFFNSTNRRHGEVDPAGLRFILARIQEEFSEIPPPHAGPPDYIGPVMVMPDSAITTADPPGIVSQLQRWMQAASVDASPRGRLLSVLDRVLTALAADDASEAITLLEAFIEDLQALSELPPDQAAALVERANLAISLLL